MSDAQNLTVDRAPRKRRGLLILAFVLAALLLGLLLVRPAQQSPNPNTTGSILRGPPYAYSYTCCSDAQFNAIYHPGQVVTFHWIRSARTPTRVPFTPITLSISLSGPYRTVSRLKHDSVGAHPRLGRTNASAVPVLLMNNKGTAPVSILQIPPNAGAGYYNVTITTGTTNLTESGATVIRIRQ